MTVGSLVFVTRDSGASMAERFFYGVVKHLGTNTSLVARLDYGVGRDGEAFAATGDTHWLRNRQIQEVTPRPYMPPSGPTPVAA